MTPKPQQRIRKDDVLTVLGYALPVLGGLLGVAYVNTKYMDFINPVWAVGAGALLGWIIARVIRKVLG
ncbi:hypothetical protein I5192_06725 [Ruegeria sp. SCSIO 43209]|uniref:hypothetical protein n=1 Tax=Ruegeria sp. SCSIO 43209 TaxID=2793010 RepID=UPI00147C8609|nr:hypothetical protein [Ruegeria sp. SCSIO 43209]UAB90349.1 hypothetical protein I5192_06725 [Ruegeria sp. SCSIO 43209]